MRSKRKTSSSLDWSLWIKSLGFGLHFNPWTALTQKVMVEDLEIIALMKILTLSKKFSVWCTKYCRTGSARISNLSAASFAANASCMLNEKSQKKLWLKHVVHMGWLCYHTLLHSYHPPNFFVNDKQLDQFMRSSPSSSYNSCIG